MRSVMVEIYLPWEAYHEIETKVANMPREERTALESGPFFHTAIGEYIFQEYVMSRRNLAEEIVGTTDVEITERGEIRPAE